MCFQLQVVFSPSWEMVEGVTSHGYLTRMAKMLWEHYTKQTLQGTEALCVCRFLFGDLDRK